MSSPADRRRAASATDQSPARTPGIDKFIMAAFALVASLVTLVYLVFAPSNEFVQLTVRTADSERAGMAQFISDSRWFKVCDLNDDGYAVVGEFVAGDQPLVLTDDDGANGNSVEDCAFERMTFAGETLVRARVCLTDESSRLRECSAYDEVVAGSATASDS